MTLSKTMNPLTSPKTAAYSAIGAAGVTLLWLVALHFLSPEFDPAWRMVSEYANGRYAWALSLFFICWAISSWALAAALWSQVTTRAGKIGLYFLVAAGVGEFMGGLFDINHPLHGVSALIGIPSLALAAMLLSFSLIKNDSWASAKPGLLGLAHLTWISIVLMAVAFGVLIGTVIQSGVEMTGEPFTTVPQGVIAVVGWANRWLVLVYNGWVIFTAQLAAKNQ